MNVPGNTNCPVFRRRESKKICKRCVIGNILLKLTSHSKCEISDVNFNNKSWKMPTVNQKPEAQTIQRQQANGTNNDVQSSTDKTKHKIKQHKPH